MSFRRRIVARLTRSPWRSAGGTFTPSRGHGINRHARDGTCEREIGTCCAWSDSSTIWGLLALSTSVLSPQAARALDVQCIEASKYKHLYLIFGNDRRKFAQYLRLNEASPPDPEVCRAVLVTGPIEPRARSRERGQPTDPDKLLQAVADNRGWLATVYLASGGGNIGAGLIIAEMTRMFWLNRKRRTIRPSPIGRTSSCVPPSRAGAESPN